MPQRGDYYEQTLRRRKGRHKLPWYMLPPSAGCNGGALHDGLDAGTVFGPVHDVDSTLSTHGFISVLVPPPWAFLPRAERVLLPSLVWINVYKNQNLKGHPAEVHWARRVDGTTVQTWRNQGWQDYFWFDY